MKKIDAAINIFIILLFISQISIFALSVMTYTRTLRATGRMKGVGIEIFSDPEGTQKKTTLFWGDNLSPGDTILHTVYVQSTRHTPVTLSFYTDNYSPLDGETYLSLSWNYNGTTLYRDEILPVTFALQISSSITGIDSFSFDITIVGTG